MKVLRFDIFLFFFFLFFYNASAQEKPIFLADSSTWVDSIMLTLSEEERIGQLFMVAAYSNKSEKHRNHIISLIEDYKIGGLMFLQGGPLRQANLTNLYQSKTNIPLMIAIDAEWGVSMRLDSAIRFPWQMTLGAIQDTNLIYKMGVEIARQCKLLGIHINFAPVVDVNSNPNNPIINNRSFGEDPLHVSTLGVAYMKGMQNNQILACAKHFPGHGDTDTDSHKTLPIINHSFERIDSIELTPFKHLINNGLGSVMAAHLHIPVLDSSKNMPASLSPKIINGLLKKDLDFKGLVFTDALNMKGVSDFYNPGELDVKALLAGNDVLLFPENVPRAISAIQNAVLNKEITQDEIDEKCRKILLAKYWCGLDRYKPIELEDIKDELTNSNSIFINDELVESSLTLLQNYESILPLKNIDTLKIASLSIGGNSNAFQDMLLNYAPIDFFQLTELLDRNHQAILLSKLSQYNLVIVSIHLSNKSAWEDFKIKQEIDVFLQTLALQNKVVVSIFANPYSLNSFLFTNNFDALSLGYQNSVEAQEKMAQAIFGGIGFSGKIPVSTNHFDIKTGIRTSPIRMSYVDLLELNINPIMISKIDSIVEDAIEKEAMPGCQVLIAKSGKIFHNQSYGYHTYKKEVKVKNSDVYDLASITKIAATLPVLMQMVDDKEISLDDKLDSYLALHDSINKNPLIIREILAHQSGLQSWIPFYKETLVHDSVSGLVQLRDTLYSKNKSQKYPHHVADSIYLHFSYTDTIMEKIYNSDLLDQKKYCYSDLGYYMLKQIIESIYKEELNYIVDSIFYKKLGMENLGYLPIERINKSRIIPTEEDFEFRGQVLKGYVHDMGAAMQGGVGGHAGLFSNANDLAKLMQLYLQEGEYAEERYIEKRTLHKFTKCQYPNNDNRRGAGFDKPALEGQEGGPACEGISYKSFGHSGFTGTLAWADPENEIVYIFLSNRIHPDASNTKLLDMNVRTDIMQVILNYMNE